MSDFGRQITSLLVLLLGFASAGPAHAQRAAMDATHEHPRNVILFIADGGGPASFTMARDYVRWKEDREALAFDSLLVGSIRTFSTDSRVTDSAAGATAFSTGVKTYNGAIAVDDDRNPLGTILEGAENKGMATGLLATSRITHATPASFAAHVTDRWMEDAIASQMIAAGVDVLMGGGRRHLLPETTAAETNPDAPVADASQAAGRSDVVGSRSDGRNLLDEARANGYHVVEDRSALMEATETPLLAALATSHLDYEVDRDPAIQPSLAEMTEKAIALLGGASDEGFFLMVEGSRIDHAAHANDAAAHLFDVLAYEEAMAAALAFARRDGRTLVLATSDHETGGFTLGRDGIYAWYPEVVDAVTASHDMMIDAIEAQPGDASSLVQQMTGLDSLSAEERELLATALTFEDPEDPGTDYPGLNDALASILARRALVGWTTTGHSGVDVGVYAYGPGRERFVGNRDNTYVGLMLADLLDVDLKSLTASLRRPLDVSPDFEIVGHRGARGLLPENSIPSFRRALQLGVNTLEIDVVGSKDGAVIVSHEPWMHHVICLTPDGEPISEAGARSFNIFRMTYEEVTRFDCGTPGHPDFPEQVGTPVGKPLLRDVIEMGEEYSRSTGREPVWYNIEIKSDPEWDGTFAPPPEEFMPHVYEVLTDAGVRDRAIIQSFDPRPLRVMHEIDPSLTYALLVGRSDDDTLEENIDDLGFVPNGYNPNYHLVDAALVRAVHDRGMTLVPWTVNQPQDMERLIDLGVDGLITDYPDRARDVLRRKKMLP